MNNKRNKALAVLLSAFMTSGMIPINALAAVAPPKWSNEQVAEDQAEDSYWPLAKGQRLVKQGQTAAFRGPSLSYVGTYNTKLEVGGQLEDRQVVRLSLNEYVTATVVYNTFVLKLNDEFLKKVDVDNVTITTGTNVTAGAPERFPDNYMRGKEKLVFKGATVDQVGARDVFVGPSKPAMESVSKASLPIDIVLKKGETIEGMSTPPIIQGRLMDGKYKRIYAMAAGTDADSYSSYTLGTSFSTTPEKSLEVDTHMGPASMPNDWASVKFYSGNNTVEYDKSKSVLRVKYKTIKNATADAYYGRTYAFRQAFDSRLAEVLQEKTGNQTIATIYWASQYGVAGDKKYEIPADYLNKRGDVSYIQVSTKDYPDNIEAGQNIGYDNNDTKILTYKIPDGLNQILSYAATTSNQGTYTVVEYNVDPVKMKKVMEGDEGLGTFSFWSAVLLSNPNGRVSYTWTADKDYVLEQGKTDNIELTGNSNKNPSDETGFQGYDFLFEVYSNGRRIHLRDIFNNSYNIVNKNFSYWNSDQMPFTLAIKKGDTIKVTMQNRDQDFKLNGKLNLKLKDKDSDQFDVIELDQSEGKRSYLPEYDFSSLAYGAGSVVKTTKNPKVKEVFTDSTKIDGYLYFEEGKVSATSAREGQEPIKLEATSVGDTRDGEDELAIDRSKAELVTLNDGQEYRGWKYSMDANSDFIGNKDYPISFVNSDTRQVAEESDPAVVEQVQAKVIFDLNGGKSPVDTTLSYEGVQPVGADKKYSDYNYITKRSSDTDPIVRIAPLNANYAIDPTTGAKNNAYVPSGFEGKNLKVGKDASGKEVAGSLANHEGYELTGDALNLRKFPGKESTPAANPVKDGYVFYGWSTKQLFETSGNSIFDQWNKMTEATTLDETNGEAAHKFTANSPVDRKTTVYAVYGPAKITLHDNDGVDPDETKDVGINTTSDKTTLPTAKEFINKAQGKEKSQIVGWSKDPKATVPDTIGGKPLTSGMDLTVDQINSLKGDDGQINLYAVWKDAVSIKVSKEWSDNKNSDVKVGLMYRTAVGEPGSEIVNTPLAVYRAVKGSVKTPLAVYRAVKGSVKTLNNNEATWTDMRGYDDYGFRHSYIAVELNDDTEKIFNNDFVATTADDWAKLGIKIVETTLKPDGSVDVVGHKTQDFTVANGNDIDAYSSATVRTRMNGSDPANADSPYYTSYNIKMTNTKVQLPSPIIGNIFTGDKSLTITPPAVDGVEKIVVSLPNNKTVTLTNGTNGYTTTDSSYTVENKDGKIIITPKEDPGFKSGDVIKAVAHKEGATAEGTQTVKDRESSAKPTIDKQGENDRDGNPTVIATPGLLSGTEVPEGTTFELVKKDKDGNYVVVDGPIAKDKIKDGKITFTPDKSKVEDGDEVFVRQNEPGNNPSISEGKKLDLAGPVVTIDDIVGIVGKAYTQDFTTDENASITIENLASGLTKTDGGKNHKITGTATSELSNKIRIVATDSYGNKSEKIVDQKFTKMVIEDPTGEIPEGYVRLTFEKGANGTLKVGAKSNLDKKVYDVAKGVTIEQAKSANPAFVIPTIVPNAGYEVSSQNGGWNNPLPTEALSNNGDFIAQYSELSKVIEDPTGPVKEGYVRVTFSPTPDGTLNSDISKDLGKIKIYDVRKDITWSDAKTSGMNIPEARYKDSSKVFKEWDPVLPTDTSVLNDISNRDFEARYVINENIIPFDPTDPNDPNKENPDPNTYVKVVLDANGGTFANGTKSNFYVKKTYDVKASDFDAAKNALTAPSGEAFKEWSEKNGEEYTAFPAAGKKFTEDATVYATYETVEFDKDNITGIDFVKDPNKMNYTDGDKLDVDGVQIKLTDKNGKTVTIGKDELDEYGVKLTPADKTELKISDNGKKITAKVDGTDLTADSKGDLSVVDKAKNPSAKPEITKPTEGDKEIIVTIPKNPDGTTPSGDLDVKVNGEPVDKDDIKDNGDGTYTVTVPELNKDDTVDATFTEKTKEPSTTPEIKQPNVGDTEVVVSVPGNPEGTLVVKVGEKEVEPEKVVNNGDGTYTVTVPELKDGDTIDATFTEDGKTPSDAPQVVAKGENDSTAPVIKQPNVGDTTVTVTVPENPTGELEIKINGEVVDKENIKSNGDGTYTVTTPEELKDGDTIEAIFTEKDKNPSAPAKAVVKEKVVPEVKDPTDADQVKVSGKGGTSNGGGGGYVPTLPDDDRVSGNDRIETAIEVSKKYFDKADTVIIANYDKYPDSLTASTLSKLLNAPILLTTGDKLDSRVAAEIKRLGATQVIISGGDVSVTDGVKKELSVFDKDDVERLGGADRYETSSKIAARVVGITGKLGYAAVASGENFADALAIGPFASREGYPILLVKKNEVPKTIKDSINTLGISKVYIAGGKASVSDKAASQLPNVVERMGGADRYETSVIIAKSKFNGRDKAFVASGEVFADALVISPVGGKLNQPILLVKKNEIPKVVKDYIASSNITKFTVAGGENTVSNLVFNELKK